MDRYVYIRLFLFKSRIFLTAQAASLVLALELPVHHRYPYAFIRANEQTVSANFCRIPCGKGGKQNHLIELVQPAYKEAREFVEIEPLILSIPVMIWSGLQIIQSVVEVEAVDEESHFGHKKPDPTKEVGATHCYQ